MNRTFILVCFKIKEEIEKFFDYFTNKLDSCTSKSLQKLNKTPKKEERDNICLFENETEFYLTNAVAETNNNTIQTYINVSFGLTNFHRLRKRILYKQKKEEINRPLLPSLI